MVRIQKLLIEILHRVTAVKTSVVGGVNTTNFLCLSNISYSTRKYCRYNSNKMTLQCKNSNLSTA